MPAPVALQRVEDGGRPARGGRRTDAPAVAGRGWQLPGGGLTPPAGGGVVVGGWGRGSQAAPGNTTRSKGRGPPRGEGPPPRRPRARGWGLPAPGGESTPPRRRGPRRPWPRARPRASRAPRGARGA